ncbi:conserved hypothetical protein [Frankia canadensis]|uniref:DUF2599 domain-containing protein n=1 Tax=Frankia canadensis TaxID=1836972 RepID=A0A2I2KP18_9ACTN|nr:conserved hypothetical protein [Frankia canadensis]SOU54679.1 conserved hypothetical protein [Frankia canadensis]
MVKEVLGSRSVSVRGRCQVGGVQRRVDAVPTGHEHRPIRPIGGAAGPSGGAAPPVAAYPYAVQTPSARAHPSTRANAATAARTGTGPVARTAAARTGAEVAGLDALAETSTARGVGSIARADRPVVAAGRSARGLIAVLTLIVVGALTACASEGGGADAGRADTADSRAHMPPPSAPHPSTSRDATPAPTAGAAAGARAAGRPYCGASQDVEEIVVEQWADGRFRVSLRPTDASRRGLRDKTTAVLWSAVGACVPNLGGPAVADSLHAQLACHQALAEAPALHGGGYATGDTYDLESWRPLMRPNSFSTWLSTHCGNTLGTDPTGSPTRTYRPDGRPIEHTTTGEHA